MGKAAARKRAAFGSGLLALLPVVTYAATLTATPDPVQVCDGTGLGKVTVYWNATDTDAQQVEVRVGSPTGVLFASGAQTGSADTEKWVANDTAFILINSANRQVLAEYKARLSSAGCSIPDPRQGFWRRFLGWFGW